MSDPPCCGFGLGGFVGWGEASSHRVFGDGSWPAELGEVVGAAGLGAEAGEFVAAEGLAFDEGAGDLAVEVEVADAELAPDAVEGGGGAGEAAAGEGVFGVVG